MKNVILILLLAFIPLMSFIGNIAEYEIDGIYDLKVELIRLNQDDFKTGDDVTFKFSIKNVGNSACEQEAYSILIY